MEIYEPAKVGRCVAWGRAHSIYRYGDAEIIRFPRMERWLETLMRDGLSLRERFQRDISICEQYFGDYFLATRVVEDAKGEVATIQPYITGHYLSKEDLRDESIKRRLKDMVARYETMAAAGYEVDLIGQGGVLRRRLSNVLVCADGSLKLFDATIADMGKIGSSTLIARCIAKLVLKRQRSMLRFLLS